MLASEIRERLEKSGLPLAYRFFPEDEPPPGFPYLVWYIDNETPFPADGENYYTVKHITVELYTGKKDVDAEAALEKALSFAVWEKTEEYIDSEKCYQITYYLEV